MHKYTLFETLRTVNKGKGYLWLDLHLRRLKNTSSLKPEELKTIQFHLRSLLPFSQEEKIKISVSPQGVFFEIKNLQELPRLCYEKGVKVKDVFYERIDPNLKYQAEAYKIYGKPEDEHWEETFFIDTKGFVREGNITNVFFLLDGTWVTPPKEVCFPGLMRERVLKKLKAKERMIKKEEALRASSILLTNSVKGAIPVRTWGNQEFSITQNTVKNLNKFLLSR